MDSRLVESERGEVENPTVMPISESFCIKMSRALFFSKEWLGEGSLAQVWVPIKSEGVNMLSTTDNLFLLYDDTLDEYRRASTLFTFDAEASLSSVPSRVFASKVPEWTPSVIHYNHNEFSRMHLALQHRVCGSLVLPVFEDAAKTSCCAVLEVVTTQEKPNFETEMDAICTALQIVKLSSCRPPRLNTQSLSLLQNAALGEIKSILCTICVAHQIPLALTWVPCEYPKSGGWGGADITGHNGNKDPNQNTILCVDALASYWKDPTTEEFLHACTTHPLLPGQGIAGKSLQSNQPLFHPDVKQFHIGEYPLVQHARRCGVSAAIAIKIRSAFTGTDDYVLEFFLPEQGNIADTMRRILKCLMGVPNLQLLEEKDIRVELLSCGRATDLATWVSLDQAATNVFQINLTAAEINGNEGEMLGKKRSSIEKSISLGQLQQYFTGAMSPSPSSRGAGQFRNLYRSLGRGGGPPNTIKRLCRKKEKPPRQPSGDWPESMVAGEGCSMAMFSEGSEDAADFPPDSKNKAPVVEEASTKAPVVEEASTSFNHPSTSGGGVVIKEEEE